MLNGRVSLISTPSAGLNRHGWRMKKGKLGSFDLQAIFANAFEHGLNAERYSLSRCHPKSRCRHSLA